MGRRVHIYILYHLWNIRRCWRVVVVNIIIIIPHLIQSHTRIFLPTFSLKSLRGFAAIIQTLPYSPLRVVVVLLGNNTDKKEREEEVKEGALFKSHRRTHNVLLLLRKYDIIARPFLRRLWSSIIIGEKQEEIKDQQKAHIHRRARRLGLFSHRVTTYISPFDEKFERRVRVPPGVGELYHRRDESDIRDCVSDGAGTSDIFTLFSERSRWIRWHFFLIRSSYVKRIFCSLSYEA